MPQGEKATWGHHEGTEPGKAEAMRSRKEAIGTEQGEKLSLGGVSGEDCVRANRSTAEAGVGGGGAGTKLGH